MVALVLAGHRGAHGPGPRRQVEEVYMGCANQAGEDNRNVARMGTLLAGFPVEVAAVTFNRLCASGLNAVNMAARAIKCGEGDVFIAGGVESMSRGPYAIPKSGRGWPVGNVTAWDSSFGWRFPNPKMEALFPLEAMGETAENIRERETPHPITREAQDAFAFESQRRAVAAINSGRFQDEIAPVTIPQRRGDPVVVEHDEHPRYHWEDGTAVLDTTPEKMAKLRPVFRQGGTVTAGMPVASMTARRRSC
jgi:acetyl-CoA acetyltransferase